MKRLNSWTTLAASAIVAVGLSVLPASAQDIRQDRTALKGARQQVRDAYKSGDPAAIKAARENLQKTRGSLRGDVRERRGDIRDLHHDRQDRRADERDLHPDVAARRARP